MPLPSLPALCGVACLTVFGGGGIMRGQAGGAMVVAPIGAPRRLGPFFRDPAPPSYVDAIHEPSPSSVRDASKRTQAAGGLHAALVQAIKNATPALVTHVSSSTLDALTPFLDGVRRVGGTLPGATLVACADDAALAACEAAAAAERCVARFAAAASPEWAPVELVAEAVSGGFAVIYSDVGLPLVADPRAALEPLAEKALADAAAGGAASGWDATVVAARNTPAARALLAAWLARADTGRHPATELGAAAVAARALHPRLVLRSLPATAWAADCESGRGAVVRRAAACAGA